jgi:Spy/CpxP family protein refolding chaperone
MEFRHNFKWVMLGAALMALLVAPAWGQTKEQMAKFKEHRAAMIKQMKLAPDKEKALLAVEDKYAAARQETIATLKKNREALQAAVQAPNPDEAKVKELVSAANSGQDSLFTSFKNQRDEELALLSPVEQGKYLVAMSKWREEMSTKALQKGPAQKK